MDFNVEFEQEDDGRWIAEIPEIPGAFAYGATPLQAGARARALALRVLADRMESEAAIPGINSIAFVDHYEPVAQMTH
jgi:predicted RNase H-like HicB family nuclease